MKLFFWGRRIWSSLLSFTRSCSYPRTWAVIYLGICAAFNHPKSSYGWKDRMMQYSAHREHTGHLWCTLPSPPSKPSHFLAQELLIYGQACAISLGGSILSCTLSLKQCACTATSIVLFSYSQKKRQQCFSCPANTLLHNARTLPLKSVHRKQWESIISCCCSSSGTLGKYFSQVACGGEHTVLLQSDGHVKYCGSNTYGQCGRKKRFREQWSYTLSVRNAVCWFPMREQSFAGYEHSLSRLRCFHCNRVWIAASGHVFNVSWRHQDMQRRPCDGCPTDVMFRSHPLSHMNYFLKTVGQAMSFLCSFASVMSLVSDPGTIGNSHSLLYEGCSSLVHQLIGSCEQSVFLMVMWILLWQRQQDTSPPPLEADSCHEGTTTWWHFFILAAAYNCTDQQLAFPHTGIALVSVNIWWPFYGDTPTHLPHRRLHQWSQCGAGALLIRLSRGVTRQLGLSLGCCPMSVAAGL